MLLRVEKSMLTCRAINRSTTYPEMHSHKTAFGSFHTRRRLRMHFNFTIEWLPALELLMSPRKKKESSGVKKTKTETYVQHALIIFHLGTQRATQQSHSREMLKETQTNPKSAPTKLLWIVMHSVQCKLWHWVKYRRGDVAGWLAYNPNDLNIFCCRMAHGIVWCAGDLIQFINILGRRRVVLSNRKRLWLHSTYNATQAEAIHEANRYLSL